MKLSKIFQHNVKSLSVVLYANYELYVCLLFCKTPWCYLEDRDMVLYKFDVLLLLHKFRCKHHITNKANQFFYSSLQLWMNACVHVYWCMSVYLIVRDSWKKKTRTRLFFKAKAVGKLPLTVIIAVHLLKREMSPLKTASQNCKGKVPKKTQNSHVRTSFSIYK